MGNTDGSFIEGEIALLSTAATSASRPRALTGGVVDSLGRLVRLDRPEEEGRADDSLLRSGGKPAAAGFRSTAGALGSPPWLFDPRAMKSPGGGCAAKEGQQFYDIYIFFQIQHTVWCSRLIPDGFAALGRLRAVGLGRFILRKTTSTNWQVETDLWKTHALNCQTKYFSLCNNTMHRKTNK